MIIPAAEQGRRLCQTEKINEVLKTYTILFIITPGIVFIFITMEKKPCCSSHRGEMIPLTDEFPLFNKKTAL